MTFDFKKEFKEFYMPKNKPEIVTVPKANYIAVRGKGNPNEEGGEYQQAVSVLYAIAYTLKMSYKSDYKIEGFFEYVVPPLEGFWWQDGVAGCDYSNKAEFNWISVIRLPDFVTKKDFDWAVETASEKKKWTVPEPNSLQLMRVCVFRLCITDLLMMSPQRLRLWINFLKIMDTAMTLAMADFTMKSICLMQEELLLKSGKL